MQKRKARDKILHYYAYSCYTQGMWAKSIATYRHLVMFNPGNYSYWYGLGSSLMMSGNDEEAAHAFEIASIQGPEDPRPQAYLAECASRLGRSDCAQDAINQAEKLATAKFAPFLEQVQLIKERIVEVNNGSR